MDMITLAMAKKYTDEKAGYASWDSGSITFDGDVSDKLNIPASELGFEVSNVSYVRFSEKSFPAKNIKQVGVRYANSTSTLLEEFDITDMGEASFVFVKGDNIAPLLFIVDADTDMHGIFARVAWKGDAMDSIGAYVNYISGHITENVHPIDPKYIPAMDSITMNGADGKQYKVAVDASGVLTATAIE